MEKFDNQFFKIHQSIFSIWVLENSAKFYKVLELNPSSMPIIIYQCNKAIHSHILYCLFYFKDISQKAHRKKQKV